MPHSTPAKRNAWRNANKERINKGKRLWHAKTKAARRAVTIKGTRRNRGLPEPTRPEPKYCECCANPPMGRGLALDHDHATGRFRGWLCGKCNVGIGALGDNLAGIRLALSYLQRHTRRVVMHKDDESYLE